MRPTALRAALYLRRSTEEHQAASLEVQEEEARRFVKKMGWTTSDEIVFVDSGVSRAEFAKRPGLVALLRAVERGDADVVVTRDETRLGGDMVRVSLLLQDLLDAGVKVYYYFTGEEVRLDDAVSKFMVTARNFAAELEREKIAQRTHEHLLVKARRGLNVGGRVYGYDNVEVREGDHRKHVEYAVNPQQAAVVVEIYERYARGEGLRAIAKALNARRIPSPRAGKRGTGSWSTSALWSILRRPRYVGVLEWNRVEKTYRKGTKVRVQRDSADWMRVEAPQLRIVSDELWNAVQQQMHRNDLGGSSKNGRKGAAAKKAGRPAEYLLSGITRCAVCGGPLTVVNTRAGTAPIKAYACAYRHSRGEAVCTNAYRRPIASVNAAVVNWIQGNILSEQLLLDTLKEVRRRLAERSKQAHAELPPLEARAAKLRAEIANIVDILACTPKENAGALVAGMCERQEELNELDTRIRTARAAPGAIQLEAKRMEAEAKRRLVALREALDRNPKEARAIIAAAFEGKLTATPIETPDGPRFQIEGTASLGRMLAIESDAEGVTKNPPEKFASPGGPEPLWNPPDEGQMVRVPIYLRAC
jgi:DNA invertase Pin-like site-specific DNA recombinase